MELELVLRIRHRMILERVLRIRRRMELEQVLRIRHRSHRRCQEVQSKSLDVGSRRLAIRNRRHRRRSHRHRMVLDHKVLEQVLHMEQGQSRQNRIRNQR